MSAVAAFGQKNAGEWSVIPRVGATFAKVSGESIYTDAEAELKSGTNLGVSAGVDVEYQFNDLLALSVGAYFQRLGGRFKDTELATSEPGKYEVWDDFVNHLDYVSVPFMAHFNMGGDNIPGLTLNVGVQPQFLLSSKMSYNSSTVTIGKDGSYTYEGDNVRTEGKDFAKSFDIAIPFGVAYERQHVIVDLRYQWGLGKIYKNGFDKSRNSSWVLSVGYRI